MRLVLTGATGYLGSFTAQAALAAGDIEVLSLTRSTHALLSGLPRFRECAWDGDWIGGLNEFEPDAVIHCAAMASAEACEREPARAKRINDELTGELARAAARTGACFIAVSTDLVFDGNGAPRTGGFTEEDVPQPKSVYARSKRDGESRAIAENPASTVVRASLLYGPAIGPKEGPLGWMRRSFAAKKPVTLFVDEWRTPVYVRDVAGLLLKCASAKQPGIFHCSGPERLSRVDFGKQLLEILDSSADLIRVSRREEVPTVPPRPADVSLRSVKAELMFGVRFMKVRDAFALMREEIFR
jgi:dTDP-4-dehydrorhamnose reductase